MSLASASVFALSAFDNEGPSSGYGSFCTKEPFVGINVTSDEKGNFYLDQKKLIENAAAKVSGAKVQKLPYPLDGPSLSKAATRESHSDSKCGGPHQRKSSL